MGFGNVAVSFVYTLLYEAHLVFVNLVASAALILRSYYAVFIHLQPLIIITKYEIIQAVSVRTINHGRGS
jgi:hypothetical protein